MEAMNRTNHEGKTFGFLRVIEDSGRRRRGLVVYTCHCLRCGEYKDIISEQFRKGTVSCGCYARDETRKRALTKYKREDDCNA